MSNAVTPKHNRIQEALQNPTALRERIWELSHVSVEQRAEAVSKAFTKCVEKLEATKTISVGLEAKEVPDNPTQLRAADMIFDISGVKIGKQETGAGGGGVTVNVILPGWSVPDPSIVIDNGNNTQTIDVSVQEISDDNKIESLAREE